MSSSSIELINKKHKYIVHYLVIENTQNKLKNFNDHNFTKILTLSQVHLDYLYILSLYVIYVANTIT